MELRDVETFLVLSEELHFGRTARRLHVTQGRVSQMIQALEREIGGRLFERTSRQVRLTALGRHFHTDAGAGHRTLMRSLRECQAMARHSLGRLRIGYAATIGAELAVGAADAFEVGHPEYEVSLTAIRMFRPDLALARTEADVVLAWSPGGDGAALRKLGLEVGPVLAEVPRGLLVPAGHSLAARREVGLEDLTDYELLWPPADTATPELCDLWVPRFAPSGRPLRRAADDLVTMTGAAELVEDDVITLVARGRGLHCTVITLLEHLPFPGLTVIPISDMPPMVVVPAWPAGGENAAIRDFADSLAGFRSRRHDRPPVAAIGGRP
ncbi:LysR family transcriptional regulator [Actinoallomurus vinaceus]|uniref:LysR family transcriptional regulator n=1 Tax=Actinoallomurus vinaceus TaxID=1080074 RepID=A0ABP8U6G6_9ACTN